MTKKHSESYILTCEYINDTPELLSALYDLNLLREQVSDKRTHTSEMAMLAFVWGYRIGKGLSPKIEDQEPVNP